MNFMITTKRLVIRPYSDEDQEDMAALLMNEIVKKTYIIPDFNSKEEAYCLFEKIQEFSFSDDHYEFGIYKDNQLIGWVNDVSMDTDTIELGYVINPEYHNNGFCNRGVKIGYRRFIFKGI